MATVPQAPTESNAIQLAQPISLTDNRPLEVQKFELQQRSARLFAASGLFADIRGQSPEQSIAQAFVKIALGDSMGFNPAESMTGIDIIQGRVAISANIRAARMQRAGYSWDILQLDDRGCRIRLKFNGEPLLAEEVDGNSGAINTVPVVVSFMAEDASRAGLIGKDNYKKNPRNMYFARAITNAQRWYAPGILGANILSTEEAIDLEPAKSAQVKMSDSMGAATDAKAANLDEKYRSKPTSEGAAAEPVNPPQPPATDLPPSVSPEAAPQSQEEWAPPEDYVNPFHGEQPSNSQQPSRRGEQTFRTRGRR